MMPKSRRGHTVRSCGIPEGILERFSVGHLVPGAGIKSQADQATTKRQVPPIEVGLINSDLPET